MVSDSQIKGIVLYLTKLTHTVDEFRFRFVNIKIGKVTRNAQSIPQIQYDLEVIPKQSDIPYLWDFFSCKSQDIVADSCGMVSVDWKQIHTKVNDIYYNGERISDYGGYIPKWFNEKISKNIQQLGPKQIKTIFFCNGERKTLTLNVNYEVSSIYIDDGITTDVSVNCNQALVDNEPLENIPQDLVETIIGYMSEDDNLKVPLDGIVWDEIIKYMDLDGCEIWTNTYTYLRNIGDIEVADFNFTNHSTFSSKLCDFISGDY